MSEEKLYAVKNEDGKYWDFNGNRNFGRVENNHSTAIASKKLATIVSNLNGGRVVTFVEEPKKVVLTKKQAKIVEDANKSQFPASYISKHTDNYDGLENPLMEAFVNGYTVAKEKKYNVKVPHTNHTFYAKESDDELCAIVELRVTEDWAMFSLDEIEHYGLQDCEKKEVTDDER